MFFPCNKSLIRHTLCVLYQYTKKVIRRCCLITDQFTLFPILRKGVAQSCDNIYACTGSLISSNKHGFLPETCTITNLATIAHFFGETFDRRRWIDLVCTDPTKAFDLMDTRNLVVEILSA